MPEMDYIARFHARPGREEAVEAIFREITPQSRAEPACVFVQVYRSLRDPSWFFVHSRWTSEAAFDAHASRPHTEKLVATLEPLIDHAWDGARVETVC